jgi:hypothetical protein
LLCLLLERNISGAFPTEYINYQSIGIFEDKGIEVFKGIQVKDNPDDIVFKLA